MPRITTILFIFIISTMAITANARPVKGFHEGPYLALEGGTIQSGFDIDQHTGKKFGHDFEPGFGFLFGWNLTDQLSAELKGFYASNLSSEKREHIVSGNINGRYTFIADALTNFSTFQILPFFKAGPAVRLFALPGDDLSSERILRWYGVGPSVGGGITFLWKKYIYFGIDLQEDMFFFNTIHQNLDLAIPALNHQLIYQGGFHSSFGASTIIGVHY